MANAKPEKKTYNTPQGVMIYPRITAPDYKYKTEGEFSTKLSLPTDNPIAVKMIALADRIAEEALAAAIKADERKPADQKKTPWAINNRPYEAETDDEGNETGNTVFKFGTNHSGKSKKDGKVWKRWPKLFDAQGVAIPRAKDKDYTLQVWGGSEGSVSFEAFPYSPNAKIGAGCKFGLVAAQITKLVSGGDGGSAEQYGFQKQEGGFSAADIAPQEETSEDSSNSEGSNAPADGENDDF